MVDRQEHLLTSAARRLIIPIPSESCWYSTDTCFGLIQNQLWSLNLPIVINLSHHFSSKASCLSTSLSAASSEKGSPSPKP
uniref:Uncharacterized protein n=1 Tax=Brassica campestris TaxID=3711 RepID=A0A3P6C306_BRACM|nr:unnamed protein product [Brassica rapa]